MPTTERHGAHGLLGGASRRAEQILLASATRPASTTAVAIAVLLAGAWTATYMAGGSHTVMPHLFYVPLVTAGTRFNGKAAFVTAVCAGVLAGPLMPLDVALGSSQQTASWVIRLTLFIIIGQVVALLSHRSIGELSTAVLDHRLKVGLLRALELAQLRLVYQPLVDIGTGVVVGVEALVRWEHPERGTLSPDQFIDVAERTGAIIPMGRWILDEGLAQAAAWRSQPWGAGLKVAINVSARQLEDEDLAIHVAGALARAGLPAHALQLEVTETAMISDVVKATQRITELRCLGVAIAIDDFGTGQSSLTYMHQFKADVVKIDRSFVQALEGDLHARAVAEAVVRLAGSLGATAVAEGIESQTTADTLTGLGCMIGQGYLFSQPLAPGDLEQSLRQSVPSVSTPS